MNKDELRKKIDMCEDCGKRKAEHLYYYKKSTLFMTQTRMFLLCKKCILKPEYKQLNMKGINPDGSRQTSIRRLK